MPEESRDYRASLYPASGWERLAALFLMAGLLVVLGIAIWLNPYDLETHIQLGLPPCNFLVISGFPCPSCGMTTSFSLLMHGDLVASWQANGAGMLLALMALLGVPWCLLVCVGGKLWWFARLESALMTALFLGMAITLGRWVYVVGAMLWARMGGMP
jgi:hypothetical protein